MKVPSRIEGYAIVSADGMLANAAGVMPNSLKFEGDQAFFERGLDGVDVVVHGRNSHEQQRNSDLRRRLILTRRVSSIASDPKNDNALFWNPAGATLEQALAVLGKPNDRIGVIGGTEVFGIFLDRYDIFFLTRAVVIIIIRTITIIHQPTHCIKTPSMNIPIFATAYWCTQFKIIP